MLADGDGIAAAALDATILDEWVHAFVANDPYGFAKTGKINVDVLNDARSGDTKNWGIVPGVERCFAKRALSSNDHALVHVRDLPTPVVNASKKKNSITVSRHLERIWKRTRVDRLVLGTFAFAAAEHGIGHFIL